MSDTEGIKFAWSVAKKLCKLSESERKEIFGDTRLDLIMGLHTAHQTNFKIEEYKKREEINVGDVVTVDGGDLTFICTKDNASGDYTKCHLLASDGSVWEDRDKNGLKKTGKSVDISGVLKEI